VFIRCIRGAKSFRQKNRGERFIPGCGAGMNSLAALMAAQPGGMSADILLAHSIAAATVRRQFL
jgi:hypothetical protein